MTPDPARVREVFFAAMDLDPEAIPAFLDRACGDDAALRDEVASLLSFHDEKDLVTVTPDSLHVHELVEHRPPEASDDDGERYRGLEEIGRGGFGRVERVWDGVLKRVVARKVARESDGRFDTMLRHEARLLAWLDHPGVVPVFDQTHDDSGNCFYTMRLLSGVTLRERLDAEGPVSVSLAIRILARIAETLANAHHKGVLHLDLKPANIMLLPFGQVSVLDWGAARFHDPSAYRRYLDAVDDPEVALDARHVGVAGTPAYMPAEQATGDGLRPTTDIFAAGTVLYEMLAGRLPHPTGSALTVFHKAVAAVPPLRDFRGDVPEVLEALCMAMLDPAPAARPASFDVVLAELERMGDGGGAAPERHLSPGEVLFHEGDLGEHAYQIVSGRLAVTVEGTAGPELIAHRGPGDLVGEMAVVSKRPRSATLTAVEPTRLAVVSSELIESALSTSNPLVARMLRGMVERLRDATKRLSGERDDS